MAIIIASIFPRLFQNIMHAAIADYLTLYSTVDYRYFCLIAAYNHYYDMSSIVSKHSDHAIDISDHISMCSGT